MNKYLPLVVFSFFLFSLAGCGDSGGGGDTFSSLGDTSGVLSASMVNSDSFSSSDMVDNSDENSGDGIVIAQIHNPEPATMLLWGAGLLGAALSKKRKKNNLKA